MTENRFISLAPDDPDDSDTDMEPTEPCVTETPREDASADSDHSVYFDAREADDDTPYKLPRLLTSPTSRASYR